MILLFAACRPPGYGKEPPVDAAEVDGPAMGSADAAIDAAVAGCDHAFRLDGYATASSVWLTGTMVSWAGDPQAGAIVFTLGSDGGWTGSYKFPAGTHQYKLIVDGNNWILDPTNSNVADDGMGHTNNVYTCVP
ncbi:MAG TPA: glycogen-binding domain-containing protein [Kofleriaceae bacterium]